MAPKRDRRPLKFDSDHVMALVRNAIKKTSLDLTGLTVLTEAATGFYSVTPVIAAEANAEKVFAFTRASEFGSAAEAAEATKMLAQHARLESRIEIIHGDLAASVPHAQIVTNSGHLRPIEAKTIDLLPEDAVIALMYESWEYRDGDIDLSACRRRQIPVIGVNELHPKLEVFSFLGPLAAKFLTDAGVGVAGQRLLVICDNTFDRFLVDELENLGAEVELINTLSAIPKEPWDGVLVAMTPDPLTQFDAAAAERLISAGGKPVIAQFFGFVDRSATDAAGLGSWPEVPPAEGHMGILFSDLGPEPVVLLQTGGLRAAEAYYRSRDIDKTDGFATLLKR